MFVLNDVFLVRFDDSITSSLKIKTQKGEKLVVERDSNAHVFNGDFYVIDNCFHRMVISLSLQRNCGPVQTVLRIWSCDTRSFRATDEGRKQSFRDKCVPKLELG